MDVNFKGAPDSKLEVFHYKAAKKSKKISKAITDKCNLEFSKSKASSAFTKVATSTSTPEKPTHKEQPPKERLAQAGLVVAVTLGLDAALKTSKQAGNNSALKIAIHQAEETVSSIIQSNPEPNSPLANDIAAYQAKLAECKEKKNILLSKNKLEVVNTIMRDVGTINKNQPEIAAEVRKVTKKNAHAFEINGVTYVVSKNLPGHAKAVPAVWKRESKHFAEGSYGYVYKGTYIGTTGAERVDVMKEAKTYPEEMNVSHRMHRIKKAKADIHQEVKVTHKLHKNGHQEGIVPSPHTLISGKTTGYLVDEQPVDGIDLILKELNIPPAEIDKIIHAATAGLTAMHERGYYHGDIKPDNMLWNGERLLIGDLGGARKFTNLIPYHRYPESSSDFLQTYTKGYLSEEVFDKIGMVLEKNKSLYDKEFDPIKKERFLMKLIESEIVPLLKQNDNFALGMSLYISLTGKMPPFYRKDRAASASLTNLDKMEEIMQTCNLHPATQELIISKLIAPYTELLVIP